MKPACPRLFEAEAQRDGRLSGAELTRFQAHLEVCAACAREARELHGLAEALRSQAGLALADELRVRRERTRLLAAFDRTIAPVRDSGRERRWLFAAAAVAVLGGVATALVLWRLRSTPTFRVQIAAAEFVSVRADLNAKWSRESEARSETVRLDSGTLTIHVDHALSPPRRLRVLLPDGELEDIGTTFTVTAGAGHTTRVVVEEGRVIWRHDGEPALALSAGDSWVPAPAAVTSVTSAPAHSASAALAHSATPALAHSASASLAHSASASLAHSASTSPALMASASAPTPDPATDFRDATSALNSGDNNRAATLFSAFIAHHAADSRAEDAAYLRVLALQRAGNTRAMNQAASDYMSRYPHGFRRAEVEPLSH